MNILSGYMRRKCKIISYNYSNEAGILMRAMKSLIGSYGIVIETNTDRDWLKLDNGWWWHFRDLFFEKELISVKINSNSKYDFNEELLDI